MRVVTLHDLADHRRRLDVPPVGRDPEVRVHRVQDPPLYRLEAVADVGQGSRSDDAQRVVEVTRPGRLGERHILDHHHGPRFAPPVTVRRSFRPGHATAPFPADSTRLPDGGSTPRPILDPSRVARRHLFDNGLLYKYPGMSTGRSPNASADRASKSNPFLWKGRGRARSGDNSTAESGRVNRLGPRRTPVAGRRSCPGQSSRDRA